MPARENHSRPSPEQHQRDFYSSTADQYDSQFVNEGDEHFVALDLIAGLAEGFGYRSILDVGTGTGRGVKYFLDRHPDVEARGIEPVRAMIDQAERTGVPAGRIVEGSGTDLPYRDASFDAVCELGVLHHVPDPDAIVVEMLRVARRAVFLSDGNRFANGGLLSRYAKYGLYRLHLWPIAYRVATRGRGYRLTPADGGVAYSYSVYDSLPLLAEWADRVFLVPTSTAQRTWFRPLFGATTILLCALRDG